MIFRNDRSGSIKCEVYDDQKNIKVEVIDPGMTAYLGLQDINNPKDITNAEQIKIDFFIQHFQTYRGDGYDSYGGFDITVLHLEKSAGQTYTTACLPTNQFKDYDRKAIIGGYGRYRRSSCQTDEYGPSKHHLCNSSCVHESAPPQDSLCKQFFADAAFENLDDFGDIIIVNDDNENTYCYHQESPNADSLGGWCKVNVDASKIGGNENVDSWGFCGRNCKNDTEPGSGVLRKEENVDILDENLCDRFLYASLEKGAVEVRPRLLCIGKIARIDVKAFKVAGNSFTKINPSQLHHKSELDPGKLQIGVDKIKTE